MGSYVSLSPGNLHPYHADKEYSFYQYNIKSTTVSEYFRNQSQHGKNKLTVYDIHGPNRHLVEN
jgi:hypothetical protein